MATERKAQFTESAAKRIVKAVKAFERQPHVFNQPQGSTTPRGSGLGFYAVIDEVEPGGYKYSWAMCNPGSGGSLSADSEWLNGLYSDDNFAVETHQSKYVISDSIVWLTPAVDNDYYLFEYHPGIRIAKTGGSAIGALTGATVASGTVSLYDNLSGTLTANSKTVVAYNLDTEVVAANTYVQITYCDSVAMWLINWKACV